uniref:Uncharacterized protein n=1 Tax=Arundo donax TaxID=35708 RepID=A0A0A9BF75_ARUDO
MQLQVPSRNCELIHYGSCSNMLTLFIHICRKIHSVFAVRFSNFCSHQSGCRHQDYSVQTIHCLKGLSIL